MRTMIPTLEFLWIPLLACLVLAGIHVYLGLHVLARGIIFVDLALAQVAALGITVALLAGHTIQSEAAYWYALAFTLAGALFFAATRGRRSAIPQEAIIGIVYAVSAATAVLVVDRAPQGAEYIKQLLVGSILTVAPRQVGALALLYAAVGALHWIFRRPLLEISFTPDTAVEKRRSVGAWDFLFYASFGLVVTSSVRVAGVLLVFSYLIVPATVAAVMTNSVGGRLLIGWGLGFLVSVVGLLVSAAWDLPTGAAVVTTFGAAAALIASALGLKSLVAAIRSQGRRALAGVAFIVAALPLAAGFTLLAFPHMDHHWLNWLEAATPSIRLAFLDADERENYRDEYESMQRGLAEIRQLRAKQEDARWGRVEMSDERKERLRQYLASRSEIIAGDQMALNYLREQARERQRFWLGLPLLGFGAAVFFTLWRSHRKSSGPTARGLTRRGLAP
jgi:zinc/manganese transport system permease protein